ncbi:MAG TPA: hypothetical protein VJN18_09260 [Polyangiaceae bacterium]|nr:hypothetical protein [Polyangiaceae bacterium]
MSSTQTAPDSPFAALKQAARSIIAPRSAITLDGFGSNEESAAPAVTSTKGSSTPSQTQRSASGKSKSWQ